MQILIYILIQLVNVISGTLKYVCTVKSGPWVAALVNAVNYSLNAVLTLLMVQQEMWIAIIVSFCCNMIGVPIGKWIVNKFTKDRLWVFNATVKCNYLKADFTRTYLKDTFGIHSNYSPIVEDEIYAFNIFSKTQQDSKVIKNTLKNLNAPYHIVETIS